LGLKTPPKARESGIHKDMKRNRRSNIHWLAIAALLLSIPVSAKKAPKTGDSRKKADLGNSVLWAPVEIWSRNLVYGPGGEAHAPHGTLTFEKEDKAGTSPKFIGLDAAGTRWKAKMGHEARPETVASRFVWAIGYFTNEDYFVPELHVEGLPISMRGQQFVHPPGVAHDVRLKRYLDGEIKMGIWKWGDNPFSGSRGLNGLRVVLALMNDWDTKDANNAIYHEKDAEGPSGPQNIFLVSDLGATFGSTGVSWRRAGADGNLQIYSHSKFILKVTPTYVDFATPSRPLLPDVFYPPDFLMRVHMRWIGRRIPRADVHWMGQLLAQLSPDQIRDAFRAGGYSPDEVEGFSKIVEERIAQLSKL
jgi:hypothetical protein